MTQMIPTWQNGRLVPVEKLEAHRKALRHMAVSVFLLDGDRLLIQRRALGKYHTPGLWANTCCTHPNWDEAADACARRRLMDELGVAGVALSWRGQVEYFADVGGGLTENEVVEIFVGFADAGTLGMSPDPDEVMVTRWVALPTLVAEVGATPERFTPWLRIYLERHADLIFA